MATRPSSQKWAERRAKFLLIAGVKSLVIVIVLLTFQMSSAILGQTSTTSTSSGGVRGCSVPSCTVLRCCFWRRFFERRSKVDAVLGLASVFGVLALFAGTVLEVNSDSSYADALALGLIASLFS